MTPSDSPADIRQDILEADIRVDDIGGGRPYADSNDGMVWPTIRVTHLPTGLYAESSEAKSNVRNKEIAMRRLEAKLLAAPRPAGRAEGEE